MYQDFYQLERAPFNTTPDPAFFYASPVHQEALAAIAYGVENRKGFISLIGEVGTGKTTVLRTYIGSSELDNTRIIYLFNPNVTFDDLLVMVLRELEIEHEIPRDQTRRIDLLHRVLVREYKRGNNVVLIIDEAQNVPPETLESIRLLTNIETDSEKLIQIILCGQPELKRLLAMQSLRQLRERIAVKTELRVLTKSEAIEYIHHRLNRARQPIEGDDGVGRISRSGGSGNIFTDDAINEVIRRTGGNPRAINILCDNALITGYGYQKYPIASPVIREIAKELDDGLPPKMGFAMNPDRAAWMRYAGYGIAAVASLAVLVVGGVLLYRLLFDRVDASSEINNQAQSHEEKADADDAAPNPLGAQNAAGSALENVESSDSATVVIDTNDTSETAGVPTTTLSTTIDTNTNTTVLASPQPMAEQGHSDSESKLSSGIVAVDPQPGLDANDTVLVRPDSLNGARDVTAEIAPASTSSVSSRQSELVKSISTRSHTPTLGATSDAQSSVSIETNRGEIASSTDGDSIDSPDVTSAIQAIETTGASTNAKYVETVAVAETTDGTGSETLLATATLGSATVVTGEEIVVRTVTSGDILWNMVLDVYGVASPQIMEWLLDQNPQIANRDVISVGEDVFFPALPDRFLP